MVSRFPVNYAEIGSNLTGERMTGSKDAVFPFRQTQIFDDADRTVNCDADARMNQRMKEPTDSYSGIHRKMLRIIVLCPGGCLAHWICAAFFSNVRKSTFPMGVRGISSIKMMLPGMA